NFPAVPPGTYAIKTQLTGYKTFERTGLTLATQQFITLDMLLEPGSLEETVTVTAQSPLIDTTTASTGGTLDRLQLELLPSPGRNVFLIGVTVPTVNPVGDPQFNRQQDQTNASRVSLGGGGIRANNYLLDGVPITELRGRAIANPTIEAIGEVRVQVHTYDAEMGRTGGGVFNISSRSGANQYHGSAFYQTRPVWGQNLNFFSEREGGTKESTGVSDSYYRLYGGGVGGPIVRNRTFFWTATEGYRSLTTRNLQYVWPTARQRNGDFSQTTSGGAAVRIFNPWCRDGVASARCPANGTGSLATGGEFTNAIIPSGHPAANAVGFNLLRAWPTQTVGGRPVGDNEDGNPNASDTARIVDEADMFTLKVDHRFSPGWTLSGFYLYNNTDEPGSGIMPADFQYIENQAEFFTTLRRRPHILAINSTHVLSDSTVLAFRYGWQTWQDQTDTATFDPGLASLGFSPTYLNAINPDGLTMFPELLFDEIDDVGGWGGDRTRWTGPYAISGTVTKLMGTHSLKAGADFRRLGIKVTSETSSNSGGLFLAGSFSFDRLFTSQNGVGGHEFASLLLGLPVDGSVPFNRGEGHWFTRYYGAFLQDDWRVNSRFSLTYGVRLEHEDGLREVENRQTVAFDQDATNPIDALVPKAGTRLEGRTLRGGLVFAGVDGANEHQGDPPAIKVAPRVGATFALDPRTVIRGGYGTFYAPWQYNATNHGQIGFARQTALNQSPAEGAVPITTIDNPFPAGLQEPVGSSLGLLTGVGGSINYIDQDKGAPVVHQYSADVQRELPGDMALTIGYQGATGRDLGFAGTNNVGLNINQIDPALARQLFPVPGGGWDAAALRQPVDNPFFGIAEAGELGTRATVPLGQLLRPFPHFGNVNVFERTEGGKRQFHAVTLVLDKRLTRGWWGGRYSYTWSQLKDNQFGEDSAYQTRTSVPQNVYDLDAEYAISNFDSPHRIVLAPIIRFPTPSSNQLLLDGWTISAIVELVSGSPLNAVMSEGTSDSNLGLFGGRQRPDQIGDPNTSGSDEDRVSSADHPDARWFNAGAFQNPGAGRYGTVPRTNGDARYQFRKNLDLVISKDTRFAGGQSAQIRFEILNLTNTAKFNGSSAGNSVDLASFGRITSQRGFMRIWQLSFRYAF
ncbi:MAG TPA: TonB-dependent receptor, partial [Vicinamibacterales bacterium]|nr:TonB-dependent receptor [Vicinamibacterales bacterium]